MTVSSFRRQLWRFLIGGVALLLLVAGSGMVYQTSASASDRATHAPLGTLFEVNGHDMHLSCSGEGSPTVILEAGVGGNSLLWAYIQPSIAEVTRVCTYDRAGYGWSEASASARTTPQIAEELHMLLTLALIEPPYVVAGHSFGGMVVRTFADMYADEVTGLILIDAAHPNQFSPERCVPDCFPEDAVRLVDTFYAMLPGMAHTGLVRLLVPSGVLPLPFFAVPMDFPDRDALLALVSSNAHSDTVASEWAAFEQSAEFVNGIENGSSLPVRVITALDTYREQPLPGKDPEATTQTWIGLQDDLLNISVNSQQTVIEDATHFSLLVNPEHSQIVSAMIIDMVEDSR
jgi:pimeloyl-ACP methyl ester carboxylesterase